MKLTMSQSVRVFTEDLPHLESHAASTDQNYLMELRDDARVVRKWSMPCSMFCVNEMAFLSVWRPARKPSVSRHWQATVLCILVARAAKTQPSVPALGGQNHVTASGNATQRRLRAHRQQQG